MSSLMKKARFLAKEEKDVSQPQTEMVEGLETEKDLEDERRRRASVSSLLKVCFPASRSGCLTDRFPEKILLVECSMKRQRIGAEYRPRKIESP